MKAAYLLDQACNIENAPDYYRNAAVPVLDSAGDLKEWIIPKGTVIDDPVEALLRVSTGQAAPIDDECAQACGLTEAELKRNQRLYLSAMAGIRGKQDLDLYMAGVIDGYDKGTTDEKTVYKPGPKWDAYQAALKAKQAEDQ